MGAWEIRRDIPEDNPDNMKYEEFTIPNNLGNVYVCMQRYADSEKWYLTALENCQRLAKQHPDEFDPFLAIVWSNLGNVYGCMQRYKDSKEMYQASLDRYRHLAAKNPASYEPEIESTQQSLEYINKMLNQ